jgi:hypothetical protein
LDWKSNPSSKAQIQCLSVIYKVNLLRSRWSNKLYIARKMLLSLFKCIILAPKKCHKICILAYIYHKWAQKMKLQLECAAKTSLFLQYLNRKSILSTTIPIWLIMCRRRMIYAKYNSTRQACLQIKKFLSLFQLCSTKTKMLFHKICPFIFRGLASCNKR